MMIDYVSKVSKFLSYFKYVLTLPAIVFIILYWTRNNEIYLTLVFACMASYLFCSSFANLNEIKNCLRKEEKGALKFMGLISLAGSLIFVILTMYRIF